MPAMFSASTILVVVGGTLVIAGFLWIAGFMIGLRLRGRKLPLKKILGGSVLGYIVAVVVVLWQVVPQLDIAFLEEFAVDVTAEEVEKRLPGEIRVTRVVDGDTIVVDNNGKEEKIRVIGINTPETVDPRREVECYGPEASARAKELLEGQTVTLTPDLTQDESDRYGRLLRYVGLTDGTDFGEFLIEGGYAFEYTYETAYERQAAYQTAEATAQVNTQGIWSALCQK